MGELLIVENNKVFKVKPSKNRWEPFEKGEEVTHITNAGKKLAMSASSYLQNLYFAKYMYIFEDTKDLKCLVVDEQISKVLCNSMMLGDIFVGNAGRYFCTSSNIAFFKHNMFNVNAVAVHNISCLFKSLVETDNTDFVKYLAGWRLFESYKGYFALEVLIRDKSGCDAVYCSLNVTKSGKTYGDVSVAVDEGFHKVLTRNVMALLKSLEAVDLPIDLFEVCYFRSNENTDAKKGYCELGSELNTSHCLSGVSFICEENGFEEHENLYGGYALLYVQ